MNLSESLRHYANLLEDAQAQYIRKAIQRWDERAGTPDVPPKDPNDGLSPNQPPQPDWSAAKLDRWLLQYGDVKMINKRSRHKPLGLNSLPSLAIMLQERDWHNFVRYYAIVRTAYAMAERAGDQEAAKKIKVTLNRLQPEYLRRRDIIKQREYEQYDMEAKMKRDHPEFYSDGEEGGLDW